MLIIARTTGIQTVVMNGDSETRVMVAHFNDFTAN